MQDSDESCILNPGLEYALKILIIDIDSKIPNFAMKKVEKYHKDKGDEVFENMPLICHTADKIYVSCIFSWNKHLCNEWEGIATIGGSGYDVSVSLPEEIEAVKPHINMGFTTRGCPRKCSFCIVPQKEGDVRIVGDLLDLWDGRAKDIVVLDNNILAIPDHFRLVCGQAKQHKIRIDFNQGLDHRLLNEEVVSILATTPHKEYKFSFDYLSYLPSVEKALELLWRANIKRSTWFILVAYNTTLEEDLKRLEFLKARNQNAFVQRYNFCRDKKYIPLARWANQHHIFQKMTYEQFLERLQREQILAKRYLQ